MSFVICGEVFL